MAKSHFDLKTKESFKHAERLIGFYLNGTKEHNFNNKSGWAEERREAREYLLEIYRSTDRIKESVDQGLLALKESPKFPSTYNNLAMSYVMLKEWDNAQIYLDNAIKMKEPKSTIKLLAVLTRSVLTPAIVTVSVSTKTSKANAFGPKLPAMIIPKKIKRIRNCLFIDSPPCMVNVSKSVS